MRVTRGHWERSGECGAVCFDAEVKLDPRVLPSPVSPDRLSSDDAAAIGERARAGLELSSCGSTTGLRWAR